MSYLIEDEDGAPFPVCERCPDQVAPPDYTPPGERPSRRSHWAHVFENDEGGQWFLFNCQRPTEGRYGDPGNQATPSPHLTDHQEETDG